MDGLGHGPKEKAKQKVEIYQRDTKCCKLQSDFNDREDTEPVLDSAERVLEVVRAKLKVACKEERGLEADIARARQRPQELSAQTARVEIDKQDKIMRAGTGEKSWGSSY